jgi:phosphohistidine phosphatase
MKTLLICRHAKSDWSNLYLKDIDRELNQRGMRDAPMMGERLYYRKYRPDLIVSSTAKRTVQTTVLIASELKFPEQKIMWVDRLYHASPATIQEVIFGIDNAYNNIMVVCHNNGITDFVNQLGGHITDNIPTCGMVCFRFDTDRWEDYPLVKPQFEFFDFPKNQV